MNVSDRVNDHKDENWGGGSKLDGPQLRVSDLRLIDKLGCPYDLPRMVVGDLGFRFAFSGTIHFTTAI